MSSLAVDRLIEAARTLAAAPAGELPDAQVADELLALRKLADVAEAAYLSRLAVFDARNLGEVDGLSTRAWLRHRSNIAPGETSRSLKTAKGVQGLPVVAAALAAGDIRVPHAAAITDGASLLGTDVIAGCQDALVDAGRADEPSRLRAGLRGLGAATENRRAVREAERRDEGRWLDVTTTFDGAVHLAGVLGAEDGAVVKAAIDTLTTPTPGDDRTAAQRRADALVEVCRRQLTTGTLPTAGGEPPHLFVITDHTTLHPDTSGDTTTGERHTNTNASSRNVGSSSNDGDSSAGDSSAGDSSAGDSSASRNTNNGGSDADDSGDRGYSGGDDADDSGDRGYSGGDDADDSGDRGYSGGSDADGSGHGAYGGGSEGSADLGYSGFGELLDGNILTGPAVRRLACDAKITRIITGPGSQPLDVGRTHRTATTAQRRALRIRDNGCRFPGCTRPPDWCDAHHITPWSHGGTTDINNLILLCRKHHTTIHEHGWTITTTRTSTSTGTGTGTGDIEFTNPHGQPVHTPPPQPTRHLINQLASATTTARAGPALGQHSQ